MLEGFFVNVMALPTKLAGGGASYGRCGDAGCGGGSMTSFLIGGVSKQSQDYPRD